MIPLVAAAGTSTSTTEDMMLRAIRAMAMVIMLMGLSEIGVSNSGATGVQVEAGNHNASSHLCLMAESPLNPASKGLTETPNSSRRPSSNLNKVL